MPPVALSSSVICVPAPDLSRRSSAASAAWAAIDHAISWSRPTPAGEWVSMAVPSDGSYGIPEGLIYSFPCTVDEGGNYSIVAARPEQFEKRQRKNQALIPS